MTGNNVLDVHKQWMGRKLK